MGTPYSALEKAISLFDKGDYAEAIKEFGRLLKLDDSLQPAYYYLGMALLNEGMADEAIAVWRKGIEKFHPWPALEDDKIRSAYNIAGWINYKKAKIEKATTCFRNSIKLNADYLILHADISDEKRGSIVNLFANACKYLGIIYAEKGLQHRAIPFFEKARELDISIQGVKMRLKKALQSNKRDVEVDPILDAIPKLPSLDSTIRATAKALRDESLIVRPRDWKAPYRGFARKYSKSSYYQREAGLIEPFWTELCSEALRKANEKYRWHCWAYITNEITRVLSPKKLEELKRHCEDNEITWYNAIMRFAMAKRENIKLTYAKPEIKSCKHCHRRFFEGDIQISLFDYLIRATNHIEYCQRCLAAAFYGAHKTEKDIDTLKQDLANLVGALGFIPPKRIFDNRSFVETFPKDRLDQIIPALIAIAHPEVYEKKFKSWLNALVASGTLNDDARRLVFGTLCLAEDGHECRSLAEKVIDDWLYKNRLSHTTEPFYPRDSLLNPDGLMRADWQVGDLFIEFFGLIGIEEYEEKIDVKRKLCEEHRVKLVEITQEDLHNLNKKLQFLKNARANGKRISQN